MATITLLTITCALMRLVTTDEVCTTSTNIIHHHYGGSTDSTQDEMQQGQREVIGPPGRPGKRGVTGTPGEHGQKVILLVFLVNVLFLCITVFLVSHRCARTYTYLGVSKTLKTSGGVKYQKYRCVPGHKNCNILK